MHTAQCRQLTTHYEIIPKLFVSFTDATMAEQLETQTAKLKHTEQLLETTQQKLAQREQQLADSEQLLTQMS